MNIMGRNLVTYEIFEAVSLPTAEVLTHSEVEVADAQTVFILLSSNVAVTGYVQVSDDATNWYDVKTEGDADRSFACNNEKVCYPVTIASRYARVVVTNASGSTATITGRIMLRT